MDELRIFDAHIHIIDYNFPLYPNQGFTPDEFLFSDYIQSFYALHERFSLPVSLIGGAIVSGSFQGDDQSYLRALLPYCGANWVGVTQLPVDIEDTEIIALDKAGVKALRCNIARGSLAECNAALTHAHRVYDLVGWHTEIYVTAEKLPHICSTLLTLPKMSIDHLGMTSESTADLLNLVDHGARIKASGFGRLHTNIASVIKEIYACNPQALLFGTDLPGTRAPRKYILEDLTLLIDTLISNFSDKAVENVLYRNACAWYQLDL